jgi:alpha-L-fucosidase
VHGEAIFGTGPWKIAGEGPARSAAGMFNEGRVTYGARDVRFTTKGDTLFAFLLGWPADRRALIASLAAGSPLLDGRKVADVTLLGDTGRVEWTQDGQGLAVQLPATPPSAHAVALRVRGVL